MSEDYLALVLKFAHDHACHGCFAFAVTAYEGDFLAAFDFEVDIVDYDVVAEGFGDVLASHGDYAGVWGGGELDVERALVEVVDLYAFDLFELLDTALDLDGLCGLVAEALDELFGVGDHFLLIAVGVHLLFETFLSEDEIFGVVGFVVVYFAEYYLDGAVCDIVEESTVVGYHDDGSGVVFEEILEPLDRLYVEVVCRFVEEDHVGVREEYFGEFYAHAPSTGEFFCWAGEVGAFEAESFEGCLDFGFIVVGSHHGESFGLFGQFGEELHVVVGLVVGACGEFGVHLVDSCLESFEFFEGGLGFVENGFVVAVCHVLREVADGAIFGYGYGAFGGRLYAADYFEHCGLACSVFACEAYPVLVADVESYAVEEFKSAEGYGQVVYRNHFVVVLG